MIVIALILLGLCFGSFVNALVWRVHEQAEVAKSKNRKQKYARNLSLLHGRSMCVHCHHELAAKDLVPVLSWVFLRGRCRYCKKPIAWQYPAVELLMTVLFVISYLAWPEPLTTTYGHISLIVWLVSLIGLVALLVYDLRWMLLPNKILFPLFIPVVIGVLAKVVLSSHDLKPILDAVAGSLIGGGIFYLLFQFSGGKWIGGGDVKLGFLLGILVGDLERAFLLLFAASALGTLFILPLLAVKRVTPKSRIPFGPFLIIGAALIVLWGQQIIDWYTRSIS